MTFYSNKKKWRRKDLSHAMLAAIILFWNNKNENPSFESVEVGSRGKMSNCGSVKMFDDQGMGRFWSLVFGSLEIK